MGSSESLAELLGSVSLATDRARGQALESALGATIVATRLAEIVGLDPDGVVDTYYTAITRTIGCSATAMEAAAVGLGDDLSFSLAIHMCDAVEPASVRAVFERHFAPSADPELRRAVIDRVVEMIDDLPVVAAPTGDQAGALARRLPLPEGVPALLAHADTRWDGRNPVRSGGEDAPLVARVVEVATVAELFRRADGIRAVDAMLVERSGGQFDPHLCETARRHLSALFEGFTAGSLWDLYVASEPGPSRRVDESHRRTVAEVYADFVDNKSGWFVGHSRVVAALAGSAARSLDLDDERAEAVALAGLVHDIGRAAIPNGIWDEPGPLTARGWAIVKTHSEQTEQLLSASPAFRSIAALAGATHERRGGAGYHRGRRALDAEAELIAAADVYAAMVHDRPWRSARSVEDAADQLTELAHRQELSADVVNALLGVCGHPPRATVTYPDGLTPREVEILRLLARGSATKQIAAELGVAYKTVDNHVQNLYQKIGARSRAAAAMYAVEHGLHSPNAAAR